MLRNNRKGVFTARRRELPQSVPPGARDFDNDGRTDLACGTRQFLNRTQTGNAWIGVTIVGVKNLKIAVGSEIEVKAGSQYQKKLYHGTPLIFGLGSRSRPIRSGSPGRTV